ncbi:hypothetical protein [Telluria beijingensis]|uniref:hypothetical protein n=1 Tax=Telluria beijingensis TaxID=3068633 RepID=UPI00279570F8|nr:hypothetical protein [Massilia sp. REN29]
MSDDHMMVPVAQVQPGMVLSDELLDNNGLVLLAKGAVLTEATVASLQRHHIEAVPVARVEAHRAPDEAAVLARLDHVFRKHDLDDDGDWAGKLLRRYVEDYRLERQVAP